MTRPSWETRVATAPARCFICKQTIEVGALMRCRDMALLGIDRAHVSCCEEWQAALRRAAGDPS